MRPDDWQLHVYRDGDAELVHTVCRDGYSAGTCTLANLLHIAEGHACPGPPPAPPRYVERCEHGAPLFYCRQHDSRTLTIPIQP